MVFFLKNATMSLISHILMQCDFNSPPTNKWELGSLYPLKTGQAGTAATNRVQQK